MPIFTRPSDFEAWRACDRLELILFSDDYEELSKAEIRDIIRDTSTSEEQVMRHAKGVVGGDLSEETVESLLEEYYKNFRFRSRVFKEAYPFYFDNGILAKKNNFPNLIYKLFLLSANLAYLTGQSSSKISVDFERICAFLLKKKFGKEARVEQIGTSNTSIFSADKRKMLRQLARILNERVDEKYFPKNSSGDHGVDLVCFIPIDRKATGSMVALGQCAASSVESYWKSKKNDMDKAIEVISFSHPPYRLLLIPNLYRNLDGSFTSEEGLKNTLVLDRFRLYRNDLDQVSLFNNIDYNIDNAINREFVPNVLTIV